MQKMKSPRRVEEVTHSWIQSIVVDCFPGATAVSVLSLRPERANETGTLSSIVHAEVQFEDGGQQQQQQLFIKIMPQSDCFRSLVNKFQLDVTEICTYKVLIGELYTFELQQLGSARTVSPKMYHAAYDVNEASRSWHLVLQDIGRSFTMADFQSGLSVHQVTVAVKTMAHFHAVSFAYAKLNQVDLRQQFNFLSKAFTSDNLKSTEMIGFLDQGLQQIVRDLDERPALQHLVPKLTALGPRLASVFCRLFNAHGKGEIIIHGDLWGNNLLFNRSDEASTCYMIDWQFTTVGHPLFDFGPVALLSMQPDKTEQHLSHFINTYFCEFQQTCSSFGLAGSEMPWPSQSHLESDVGEVGFFLTMVWSVLSTQVVDMYSNLRERYLWVISKYLASYPDMYQIPVDRE